MSTDGHMVHILMNESEHANSKNSLPVTVWKQQNKQKQNSFCLSFFLE